jgi:hypothetical protein
VSSQYGREGGGGHSPLRAPMPGRGISTCCGWCAKCTHEAVRMTPRSDQGHGFMNGTDWGKEMQLKLGRPAVRAPALGAINICTRARARARRLHSPACCYLRSDDRAPRAATAAASCHEPRCCLRRGAGRTSIDRKIER